MKKISLIVAIVISLSLPLGLSAHRLDEYLQATIFTINADHIEASMRLVPGVAVASATISCIDTNHDGMFSAAEQQAYAQSVLRDLVLSADGNPLKLNLVSAEFPPLQEIEQGTGEIHINFSADLPFRATTRHLVFKNHHQPATSVYLVNTLVPADKNIQITAQSRNENQSTYQLDFAQAETNSEMATAPAAPQPRPTSTVNFSGFAAAFRLGIHHIAEGTDHLLFLLVLLLPAPLLVSASTRTQTWVRPAPIRASLLHILGIVTAFTLGHSFTLALSVFGLVTLPTRPFEVLIAVSILISAIHALRPLFPGREAAIAAFFGLVHGMAFASALNALGFNGWYRLVSLLGFNLGIETMQLAVVAAVLPSLLLLSRTRAYSAFRICGALLATIASVTWIAERLFNLRTQIDPAVNAAAHHAPQLAAALFLLGLVFYFTPALLQPIKRQRLYTHRLIHNRPRNL
jgi:HupE / UreJ protein